MEKEEKMTIGWEEGKRQREGKREDKKCVLEQKKWKKRRSKGERKRDMKEGKEGGDKEEWKKKAIEIRK